MDKNTKRYLELCKQVKHQVQFIEAMSFDFDYFQAVIDEMRQIQNVVNGVKTEKPDQANMTLESMYCHILVSMRM